MWIKVLIKIFLITIIGIKVSSGAGDCGNKPTNHKDPEECCDGFDKFFSLSFFAKCFSECKEDQSYCCVYNCGAKKLGLLKHDKPDKETAIASLQKIAGDDKDWIEVGFVLKSICY